MTITEVDTRTRLRFVIHQGLVEIRGLAMFGGQDAQIAKLADVLEFLPRYLGEDGDIDGELFVIIEQFEQYKTSYPQSRYDYPGYLLGSRDIHGF